jgi:hypothetical protein
MKQGGQVAEDAWKLLGLDGHLFCDHHPAGLYILSTESTSYIEIQLLKMGFDSLE